MTRPVWQEIPVRAWEYRPTWQEHLILVGVTVAAWLFLDTPWWGCAIAYLAACVVVCGTLGWVELVNERADESGPVDPSSEDEPR